MKSFTFPAWWNNNTCPTTGVLIGECQDAWDAVEMTSTAIICRFPASPGYTIN